MLPLRLPSDVKQPKIVQALKKAGFEISWKHGKGSHCLATDPRTRKFITVQNHLKKGELKEILKQAEVYGYDATEIMSFY